MLTRLAVENFRGLRSLDLEQLGRITLIAGKNGTGKTALLEALWLLSGPDLPELSQRINAMRGLPILGRDSLFHDLFFGYDIENSIRLVAHGDWTSEEPRNLEIFLQERKQVDAIRSNDLTQSNTETIERMTRPQYEGDAEIVFNYKHNDGKPYTSRAWWIANDLTPDGVVGATVTGEGIAQERQPLRNRPTSTFVSATPGMSLKDIAAKFGELQIRGDDQKILELVKIIEPRLTALTPITVKSVNVPVIHAYIEGMKRPIPVELLGEGLNRLLGIGLTFSESTGGLLLIDEIENGMHYSIQEETFALLLKLAKTFDVQIFATTHSHECIAAAHRSLNGQSESEFAFYRLDRIEDDTVSAYFDSEMLETSMEYNMEIR